MTAPTFDAVDYLRQRAIASCRAQVARQGLPEKIEDDAVLDRVAVLWRESGGHDDE